MLSVLCVSRGASFALPFVQAHDGLARRLGAEFVLVADGDAAADRLRTIAEPRLTVHSRGYLESVLEEALGACHGEYVLRLDDDETVSEELERWLRACCHLAGDHWKFPRAWLWRDARQFLAMPPFWPDDQTRLSVRAKAGGRSFIHAGSPFGGGEAAPGAIEHHAFLVKRREEREALVAHYDRVQPGAGSAFRGFYLPEELPVLRTNTWPDFRLVAECAFACVAHRGLPMAQHMGEIRPAVEWLLRHLGGRPARVLEIGTWHGGTASLWCELAMERVVSIDLPGGPYGGSDVKHPEERNAKLREWYGERFVGILGDSHSSAVKEAAEAALGGAADVLFIDADHTYAGVAGDYRLYSPLVRPGGAVLFHDIGETAHMQGLDIGVYRLWAELEGTKHAFVAGADWGGLGALEVPG